MRQKNEDTPTHQKIAELVSAASMTVCSEDGCDRPRKIRQFCGAHYAQLKKAGTHPKNEPRIKVSVAHKKFVDLLDAKTGDCIDWPFEVTEGYGCLSFKHKTYRVHRLICEAVNGPRPAANYDAAHECGNSLCCNHAHIVWKTHAENIADKERHGTKLQGETHHQAKLTADEAREIRASRLKITRKNMAEKYGVGISSIDAVLDGRTWSSVI